MSDDISREKKEGSPIGPTEEEAEKLKNGEIDAVIVNHGGREYKFEKKGEVN